jgi:hypothetical protein
MNKIGIPKLFWDAFELALTTKTKQLARDIADALGEDAAPLIKSLASETVGVYLFDEAEQEGGFLDMRCSHYTALPGKPTYVTACMEPVIYSATTKHTTCLHHSLEPNPKGPTWTLLTPLVYDDTPYYIDKASGKAYDEKGALCGRYSPERGLLIFEESATP